ncbi:MAG: PorT family protein [Cyclobacteriaceae bacterium]|nr:PorT family protein [Cyclobacteriaceae bacterium]
MKRAAILVILTLLGNGLYAQGTKFGIKAGLNLAQLKVSVAGYSETSNSLTAFHGGVYAQMMTSEKFGFQPELLYSAQGADEGDSAKFNLNYLIIPVMMRYDVSPGISIQAGPQVGFLMSATVNGVDVKSEMNSIDFGLGFGFGVDRPSGFSFGFRYVVGLSNTFSSSTVSAMSNFGLGDIKMTNQVIQFSVGYRLTKG